MKLYTCPHCGKNLKIDLDEGVGVCKDCGERMDADEKELRRLREVRDSADRMIRHHTAATYREAIRKLESIADAAEVEDSILYCRTELKKLQDGGWREQMNKKGAEERQSKLGLVLFILAVLFVLAAIVGFVVLLVFWSKGKLSQTAVTVLLCVIAALAVLTIFGKMKSSR